MKDNKIYLSPDSLEKNFPHLWKWGAIKVYQPWRRTPKAQDTRREAIRNLMLARVAHSKLSLVVKNKTLSILKHLNVLDLELIIHNNKAVVIHQRSYFSDVEPTALIITSASKSILDCSPNPKQYIIREKGKRVLTIHSKGAYYRVDNTLGGKELTKGLNRLKRGKKPPAGFQ